MEIRLIVGTFIVTFLVKQVIMLYTSQKKVYINYDKLFLASMSRLFRIRKILFAYQEDLLRLIEIYFSPLAMRDYWSRRLEHPCGGWVLILLKILTMIRLIVGESLYLSLIFTTSENSCVVYRNYSQNGYRHGSQNFVIVTRDGANVDYMNL